MKRIILAAIIGLSVHGTAKAAGTVIDYGPNCGDYLGQYSQFEFVKNGMKGPADAHGSFDHIRGVLSGYNAFNPDGNILGSMSAFNAYKWIASWCRDNSSTVSLTFAVKKLIEKQKN